MDHVRKASATGNQSKYMSKRARRAATSTNQNLGSEWRITTLTILRRLNSDFSDTCWTTKIEKVFQTLPSTFLILHPVPCSFPFRPPFRPLTLSVLHLCPPAATPVRPVLKLSGSSHSRPPTFGSRLVKGGEDRIHPGVPLPKGAGHHLFVFTLAPPSVQKEDEELGWGEQKCLSWAFSYRNFVFASFLVTVKQRLWVTGVFSRQRTLGSKVKEGVSNTPDTHACRLVEGVVKLRLHSDLSVGVGVDEGKPQVGVVSTSKGEKKKLHK